MIPDPIPSETPDSEEPKQEFPEFAKVSGYADFPTLEELFYDEYISGAPLIDVRNIRIHFNSRKPNRFRDFEHAAIGREGIDGARPEPCDLLRASSCVHWIRFVVTNPSVEIFHAPSNPYTDVPPDQERYIYIWKGQKAPGQTFYYYKVVVTQYLNAPEKTRFLTAYHIDSIRYHKTAKHHRRIYPPLPLTRTLVTAVADSVELTAIDESFSENENQRPPAEDERRNEVVVENAPTKPMSRNDRKRLRKQGIQI